MSAQRKLPRWRRDTFWAGFSRRAGSSGYVDAAGALAAAARGEQVVALLVDTFNAHFEPENAHDAIAVLQAGGWAVHVPQRPVAGADGAPPHRGALCCGRTYLSVGMVDQARVRAGALVRTLAPLARAGIAIVGLEPSCLFTLRDESLVLGLGDAAGEVAAHAMTFETFIAREAAAGRFVAPFEPLAEPLLVHGHCHQKAFDAVAPLLAALKLVPGAQPKLIESSCCGMAGSFGYQAAHQAVSMRMGELALFPALRADPQALVVADGTSCRHQIDHGVQRGAMHAARLLARQLRR